MRILIAFSLAMLLGPVVHAADDQMLCRAQTPASFPACQRLAATSDSDGLFGLGMLYLEGVGVARDYRKSFELMLRSANLGNKFAQVQVAQAYVNGQGVSVNLEEALAWFMVARENGNEVAKQGIEFLRSRGAVREDRLSGVTRRANELLAKTSSRNGFKFDESQSSVSAANLPQFCAMVLPTVDAVVQLRRYGRPRSDANQLMVGMTDQRAMRMMNGVIDWVWSVNVPPEKMRETFQSRCLQQAPDVRFLFGT